MYLEKRVDARADMDSNRRSWRDKPSVQKEKGLREGRGTWKGKTDLYNLTNILKNLDRSKKKMSDSPDYTRYVEKKRTARGVSRLGKRRE